MKEGFLLDTHIWLWSLVEPNRLSDSLQKILSSEGQLLFLSSISVWEAVLLGEKRRIEMTPDPLSWVRENLAQSPVQEAPINHEIALRSRSLKTSLKDPADRFLVATAAVYEITLLSADKEIQKCKEIKVKF